ncbi:MAG: hypothetical protein ACI9FB_000770 [Candidatus Azotimanducaceae bacterium]|jgi:hypothetical protein
MRLLQLCSTLLLTVVMLNITAELSAAEGKIYRSRDADGNIIFSDKAKETAIEIDIAEPSTYKAPKITQRLSPPVEKGPEPFSYQSIDITSPATDEAIRSNNGTLIVSFLIKPLLSAGHSVQLMLDGKLQQTTQSGTSFTLSNVDRGTHSIQLNIVDDKSGLVLKSSTTRNTTILRYTILLNPRIKANESRGD